MQSAVLFAGMPGPDRELARIAYRASGIPMQAKMADYIRPTLAARPEFTRQLSVEGPAA
jgi:hypothetical protein